MDASSSIDHAREDTEEEKLRVPKTPSKNKAFVFSGGIESVLQHQMSLVYENSLDGAFPKCILPVIQILEGSALSLGFLWLFLRSLRHSK